MHEWISPCIIHFKPLPNRLSIVDQGESLFAIVD